MAFSLMLLVVVFFNSDFYYNKILHEPRPSKIVEQQTTPVVTKQDITPQ
jgi:hypothetical protein